MTFFAYMVYRRITDKKPTLPKLIIVFLYIILPALTLFFLSAYVIEPLNAVITIIAHGFLASIIEKVEFKRKVFYFGISCGVSYVLYIISSALASSLMVFILGIIGESIWLLISIIAIESVFMLIIYKTRLVKPIKHNKNLTSAGTAIAGITLIIYSVLRMENRLSNEQVLLLIVGIMFCGLGIYWWVKKENITDYNESVHKLKISRQQAEILTLSDIQLELEKLLHTDSKKLILYREMVELAMNSDNQHEKEEISKALEKAQIRMAADSVDGDVQPTGLTMVDTILRSNNNRCQKCGIKFNSLGVNIPAVITESQFETLVTNMFDNAINSHKHRETREKYITSFLGSDSLTVEDNGATFSESVLADLERCKETLTPNRGDGVGIGFVTIFEIVNEYSASVEVTQNNEKKSITIRFDGENRLMIDNQYKEQELKV